MHSHHIWKNPIFAAAKWWRILVAKVLRGKQVWILYSTRCCEFYKEERQIVTVERWEDAVPERVRKPAICVLLSLREVGGCKRDPNRALHSLYCPKHFVKPECRGYAFMVFSWKTARFCRIFLRQIPYAHITIHQSQFTDHNSLITIKQTV